MAKQLRETLATFATAARQVERWTAAKYLEVSQPDDGNLIEVLDGELIMAAAPNLRHQEVMLNIAEIVKQFVRERHLGKVFVSPVDVVLGDDLVEPDVVYVSNERKSILTPERIIGAPDLLVEVLSLSTSQRDLRYKWDLYACSGVREYWVVNPETETVEVLTLVGSEYKRHALVDKEGSITSTVLSDFNAKCTTVFEE